MKKQIVHFFAFLILLTMSACKSDGVDVTPPNMEVVSYDPVPIMDEICGTSEPVVFHLTGGDKLNFNVTFKDDVALSQYKIDIHNNFDCHGHGGGSAPPIPFISVANETNDWTVLEIQNIKGTSRTVERTLNVPSNVTTGNYHFQIQVVDESGNDNPAANFFALNIKNPVDKITPKIIVQEPANNNLSVRKGETLRFVGQVTDDRSLSDGGNGVLFLSYTDLSSGNTFATDQAFFFDENIDKTFDFDFEYTIPQTLVARSYRFSLGANDGVRNVAPFQFYEVEVTN